MRLLLVEDDSMIGAAAQQGLRQDGYAVDWARDGLQAEAAIAATPYDLEVGRDKLGNKLAGAPRLKAA